MNYQKTDIDNAIGKDVYIKVDGEMVKCDWWNSSHAWNRRGCWNLPAEMASEYRIPLYLPTTDAVEISFGEACDRLKTGLPVEVLRWGHWEGFLGCSPVVFYCDKRFRIPACKKMVTKTISFPEDAEADILPRLKEMGVEVNA